MFLKRADDRLQAGYFDQPIYVYPVTSTQDAGGGEIRTPRVEDFVNSSPPPTWAYAPFANIQWYRGEIVLDGQRLAEEKMCLVSVRFSFTRVINSGDLIQIKRTRQILEVRWPNPVNEARNKVELDCRLLK